MNAVWLSLRMEKHRGSERIVKMLSNKGARLNCE